MSASMQPFYGAPAVAVVTPTYAQRITMVKGPQGGKAMGDGMDQSGPAYDMRQLFLGALASHTTEAFTAFDLFFLITPNPITPTQPISIMGGLGSLRGLEDPREPGMGFYDCRLTIGGANGRFNTSSPLTENYLETPYGFEVLLSSPRTAFTCYLTDMGEAAAAEVEFRLYMGSTLVRSIYGPTNHFDKPSSNSALFVGWADPAVQFDRFVLRLVDYSESVSDLDYVGVDDLTFGLAAAGSAPQPVVYHATNTAADAAATVTGPALAAKNAWVAAVGAANINVATFETVPDGVLAPSLGFQSVSLPFVGLLGGAPSTALAATTINTRTAVGSDTSGPYYGTIPTVTHHEVKSVNSAQRWNTTPGGSKYFEWCDELTIELSRECTNLAFFLTNIGNQNVTLRITLMGKQQIPIPSAQTVTLDVPRQGGPCYYVPKGAELNSPAGLLRFWGVTSELPFTRVRIQTIFYDSLTVEKLILPPDYGLVPFARIGIDDIMVA